MLLPIDQFANHDHPTIYQFGHLGTLMKSFYSIRQQILAGLIDNN